MEQKEISPLDLKIGKKYSVFSEDCCLGIDVQGTFMGWELFDDDSGVFDYEAPIFDFGKVWGFNLEYYEIE